MPRILFKNREKNLILYGYLTKFVKSINKIVDAAKCLIAPAF